MRNLRVVLTAGAIPLLLAVAVAAASMQSEGFKHVTQRDGSVLVRVTQPTHWVAFQAEQILNLPQGEVRSVRYRAPDGSLATYQASGAITIHNVATKRTYVRASRTSDWISYPLEPNFPPPITLQYGVKSERFKLLAETVQGLPVIELTGNSGAHTLFVPSINNLPLRAFDKDGKLLEEHRNIKLGPPPANLFSPPPGATIKVDDKPLGQHRVPAKTHQE